MKKSLTALLILLYASTGFMAGGTKEELRRLQQDVVQLQQLIRLMQDNQQRQSGTVQSLLEQLNDQVAKNISAIEGLTEALKSRQSSEQVLSSKIDEAMQKIFVRLDDTNNRIAVLRQKVEEGAVRVQNLRRVEGDIPGTVSADRVYAAAYNDYLMGNYDLAVASFRDFLANYAESEYADNAAYYLGVSQMEQGRYEAAVNAFDEVLNLHPKSDKTAPAYYKKGVALLQLRRNPEAVDVFRRLTTLFPESPEANLGRDELSRLGVDPEEPPRR